MPAGGFKSSLPVFFRFSAAASGASGAHIGASVFRGPVLNPETVHAGEFPLVVRNKGQPLRPGVRRNQQVVCPDEVPPLRQRLPDIPVFPRGVRVEGQDLNMGQESHQRQSVLLRPAAFADAEFQLRQRDRGNADVLRVVGRQPGEHDLRPFVDGISYDIGVQHILHKQSRSCTGRASTPSARKSSVKWGRLSTMLFHGSSFGIRITMLPMRLTKTSSSVKRQLFGRRTAWLPPVVKTFAVSVLLTS